MVNLKLLGAARRQTWEIGIRDGEDEEKYRISRKEGEERFSLTLSAFGILLLFYITAYGLTLLFLSCSTTAALWDCLCDLHHRSAPRLSPATIPSPCLGKTCNSIYPSCTMGTRLGPVPALGQCGTCVPASRMGHQ